MAADEQEQDGKPTRIFEKYDSLLHGKNRSKKDQIITVPFMRKYIHVAKVVKPVLTEEASIAIAENYSKLRQDELARSDVAQTQPVNPRKLETLIRLSTAHAKARLSRTVEMEDAEAAIELVEFALYHKVLPKKTKKRSCPEDSAPIAEMGVVEDGQPSKRPRGDNQFDFMETEEEQTRTTDTLSTDQDSEQVVAVATGHAGPVTAATPFDHVAPSEISTDRLKMLKSMLNNLRTESKLDSMTLPVLFERLNATMSEEPFTEEELMAGLLKLQEENRVLLASDNTLFII